MYVVKDGWLTMLFNSMKFIIFFPIVVLIYFIIPKRVKKFWLLVASYYFYMCWNAKYALLLFFSTVVTYMCGLFLGGGILLKNIKEKNS